MENKKDKKESKLLKIFLSTLYLSAFTFGGGYVIVSLLKKKFVDELGWIDENEMLDLVSIAQSSPGAIAVNGAIVVGYKLARIPGVIAAIFGAIIPPFLIITGISFIYDAFCANPIVRAMLSGMTAGIAAIIFSTVYSMAKQLFKTRDALLIIMLIGAFLIKMVFNINIIYIIITCALIGVLRYFVSLKMIRKMEEGRK